MASPLCATAGRKNADLFACIALWDNLKMADEFDNVCRVSALENVEEVLSLLWGDNVKEDIFERWSQGKYFKDPFSESNLLPLIESERFQWLRCMVR